MRRRSLLVGGAAGMVLNTSPRGARAGGSAPRFLARARGLARRLVLAVRRQDGPARLRPGRYGDASLLRCDIFGITPGGEDEARLSGDQSWTTTTLPTGHDAMITRPDLVSDLLIAQTVKG